MLGYEHGAVEQYPLDVAFHEWVAELRISRIARLVALRSPSAAMLANEMSTVSPVNWPFSRVGVSRKVSSEESFAECCMRSKTALSVALSESNVARRPAGADWNCSTAEMSPAVTVSPAPGGRICT